jgi:hypothetical protein
MPDVLPVEAVEIGDPVALVSLVEAHDDPLHPTAHDGFREYSPQKPTDMPGR